MLETACERWDGAHFNDGYARLSRPEARIWKTGTVTRAIMSSILGRYLRRDEYVCHTCDNKWCVEETHLYLGDAFTNRKDLFERNEEFVKEHVARATARLVAFNKDPAIKRKIALTKERKRYGA